MEREAASVLVHFNLTAYRCTMALPKCATHGRNCVLLQLGHGGRVSVLSSSTTVCPHFAQVYVPFPGFSPVVDMTCLLGFSGHAAAPLTLTPKALRCGVRGSCARLIVLPS
jgi:hypothetical protein